MPIRVAIADDHPLILNGLRSLLEAEGDFEVVATCSSGEEALELVRRDAPDILVLDVRLPKKDGIAILKEIYAEDLPVKVLLLTAEIDEEQVVQSIRYGVRGIVLKEMAPQLLLQCLHKVYAGEQWVERESFGKAMEKMLRREAGLQEAQRALTQREIEVMQMVAQGVRNKEIADRLCISEGTVKLHLHNVYRKLEIRSRGQLIRYAHDHGIA